MYDLSACYENTFDVMKYTISAMKEVGFTKTEIDEYIEKATKKDNATLIDVSTDYISMCNEMGNYYDSSCEDEYDDSVFWDAYMVKPNKVLNNKLLSDKYEGYEYSNRWGRDYDDCYLDDNDYYEGFNTKKYYDDLY